MNDQPVLDHMLATYEAMGTYYDRWARETNAKVAEQLVRQTQPKEGERALDVGCGTGTALRHLAQALGAKGLVLGVDVSWQLLELARRLALPTVTLARMDAHNLVLPDGWVDIVTLGQTLPLLREPKRVVRELHRVMVPGGRIAVSCRTPVLGTVAQDLFDRWISHVIDRHGLHDAHWPAPRAALGRPEVLTGLLREAGFEELVTKQVITGGRADTAGEWIDLMSWTGPIHRALLTELGPVQRQWLTEELEHEMRALCADALRYHLVYSVVSATKRDDDGTAGAAVVLAHHGSNLARRIT